MDRAPLHPMSEERALGRGQRGHGRPCPPQRDRVPALSLWIRDVLLILAAQPIAHGPRHGGLVSHTGRSLTHMENTQ